MRRLHRVGWVSVLVAAALGARAGQALTRVEEHRTPLFIYLHTLQPLEAEARSAASGGQPAEAYHLYLQALRGYQTLLASVDDWSRVEPDGLEKLVREGVTRCEGRVQALRSKAQAQDALLKRLNQPVNLNVEQVDIREVVRLLTSLTDVNIIVDDTLFPTGGPDPKVTLRVDQEVPLLQVIRMVVQQKGLAYRIEKDYVYISSRVGVDGATAFPTGPWFKP